MEDILSQNLIIAIEPEAASLYCRTLALEKFVGMTSKKGDKSIRPGDSYFIVDCGGRLHIRNLSFYLIVRFLNIRLARELDLEYGITTYLTVN